MSLVYWPRKDEEPYEYTGGRCLCDECCAARPERLLERADLRKRLDRLVKDTRFKYPG